MRLYRSFSHYKINPSLKTSLALAVLFIIVSCDPGSREQTQTKDDHSSSVTVQSFVAPADGQLNEHQILLYVAIKQTEQKLIKQQNNSQQSDQPFSSRLRYQDIEQQALKTHDLSPEEYNWIKNTVINSRTQLQFQEYFALNTRIIKLLEDTLLRYDATKSKLQDAEEIAALDGHVREINDHIATLKNQIEKYTDLSAADRFNIELVRKFVPQLRAVEN